MEHWERNDLQDPRSQLYCPSRERRGSPTEGETNWDSVIQESLLENSVLNNSRDSQIAVVWCLIKDPCLARALGLPDPLGPYCSGEIFC